MNSWIGCIIKPIAQDILSVLCLIAVFVKWQQIPQMSNEDIAAGLVLLFVSFFTFWISSEIVDQGISALWLVVGGLSGVLLGLFFLKVGFFFPIIPYTIFVAIAAHVDSCAKGGRSWVFTVSMGAILSVLFGAGPVPGVFITGIFVFIIGVFYLLNRNT